MTLRKMTDDLPQACDIGVKRNAKGHPESWSGYKPHMSASARRDPGAGQRLRRPP